MADMLLSKYQDKMDRRIDGLKEMLMTVRAGRANVGILDKITVDYYGVPSPLNQVAAVTVPEARMIVISPWDASLLGDIEKAILTSDIGINPNNDGKAIRLNFPPLTEERRKELTKTVKKYGEEAKISVRNVRRDAIDDFKKMKKDNEMTEDDLKEAEKKIQDLTDKKCAEIDKVVAEKEKDILEV